MLEDTTETATAQKVIYAYLSIIGFGIASVSFAFFTQL